MIRSVELSRVFMGGLDETATRELLGKLAASADAAEAARSELERERDELSQRAEDLEAAHREQASAGESEPYTEQALSKMIRTASDAVENLLQEAKDEAARVKAEAAAEAAKLVEAARADHRGMHHDVADLRRLLIATTSRLFDALQVASGTLESLEQGLPDTGPGDRELVQDLLRAGTVTGSPPPTPLLDEVEAREQAESSYGAADEAGFDDSRPS